jgi:hypothetical protein
VNTFKEYYLIQENAIESLQFALDLIGFEPSWGTAADATNAIISSLRAALSKEPDERKRHIINAGISAVSMIPFADLIKVLKLRRVRPAAKMVIRGARQLKAGARLAKLSDRFKQLHDEPAQIEHQAV